MKLEKKYLELLFKMLSACKIGLSLTEARKRDALFEEIKPILKVFYEDRTKIFEKFCDKDEEGNPKIIELKYTFQNEVTKELNEELNKLLEEEVELTKTDEIKPILERTGYEAEIGETVFIDELIGNF